MGYACPVCGTPQRDGEHLANHLAFTAMLRGGEHESYLDEHHPDWGERDPSSLAEAVTEHAPPASVPDASETDAHERAPPLEDALAEQGGYGRDGTADLDDDTRAVLEAARDLTAEMLAGEGDNGKE
jgi:hypothetical protein